MSKLDANNRIAAKDARRLLLGAQGLLDDPQRRANAKTLRDLIERMGFVQLDSINVVERAHHLTLASRLDEYSPKLLARLLERDRTLFEHWTHDASAIPVEWFPHWRHRFERHKQRVREINWWRERMAGDMDRVIEHVRTRIEQEGPLQSRDFEHDRNGEAGGWWKWKPQKAALEYLWRTGELAIAKRVNFQKVYDLTERVLPAVHVLPTPDWDEHVDALCRGAMQRLGAATPTELADFWFAFKATDARGWCERAAAKGEIVPVMVEHEDGTPPHRAYALADWQDRLRNAPEPPDRVRLLSPFDPVVRDRKRLARLFGYEYRFEAFVPEAKRVYGYYVLPVMERDRMIGRVDPKFHRAEGWLEIRNVWWERGVRPTRTLMKRLEEAVNRLAASIGAAWWSLP
jgi:uncharacterized protein